MSLKYEFGTENRTVFFEQNWTGAGPEYPAQLTQAFLDQFSNLMLQQMGMPVAITSDTIDTGGLIGGLKKLAKLSATDENLIPCVIIRSTEHKEYAGLIIAFKLNGRVLNVRIGQLGDVSKNYQRVRTGKLLGNKRNAEDEDQFYDAVVSVARQLLTACCG